MPFQVMNIQDKVTDDPIIWFTDDSQGKPKNAFYNRRTGLLDGDDDKFVELVGNFLRNKGQTVLKSIM